MRFSNALLRNYRKKYELFYRIFEQSGCGCRLRYSRINPEQYIETNITIWRECECSGFLALPNE